MSKTLQIVASCPTTLVNLARYKITLALDKKCSILRGIVNPFGLDCFDLSLGKEFTLGCKA
eukprot:4466188-Amphidinium_carterae.1